MVILKKYKKSITEKNIYFIEKQNYLYYFNIKITIPSVLKTVFYFYNFTTSLNIKTLSILY